MPRTLDLLLLLVLAVLLLMPLLGFGSPPPLWLIAALLLVRLALRFYFSPSPQHRKALIFPTVFTVLVCAYLFFMQGSGK